MFGYRILEHFLRDSLLSRRPTMNIFKSLFFHTDFMNVWRPSVHGKHKILKTIKTYLTLLLEHFASKLVNCSGRIESLNSHWKAILCRIRRETEFSWFLTDSLWLDLKPYSLNLNIPEKESLSVLPLLRKKKFLEILKEIKSKL